MSHCHCETSKFLNSEEDNSFEKEDKIKNEFRIAGNVKFGAQDFLGAIASYSSGLAICSSSKNNSETNRLLLANRSAAYLNLGLYLQALADAESVLAHAPTHGKGIYRKTKSLFGLARYEEAIEFLQDKQENLTSEAEKTQVSILLEKAKLYQRQQKFGEYNMAETIRAEGIRLDLANYTDPVEIREGFGEKGRGLFATEDISAGQLLIGCKAFDIVFTQNENDSEFKNSTSGNLMKLIKSISKLLTLNPDKGNEFYKLYAGPDLGHLSEPDERMNTVDLKRIEGICTFNGFGLGDPFNSQTLETDSWGVWILPSYINHSCVDCNCTWRNCGDFMFVRAFKPIKKDEEILISYLPPEESLESRTRILAKHNFTCDCRLCRLENSEPERIQRSMEKLRVELSALVKVTYKTLDVNLLTKIISELEHLRPNEELNYSLLIGLRKLSEWYYGHFKFLESAQALERVHKILNRTVVCRLAVHVAVNIISSYIRDGCRKKAKAWITILKENVRIAYGTPVKDIIFEIAPNTAKEIICEGFHL